MKWVTRILSNGLLRPRYSTIVLAEADWCFLPLHTGCILVHQCAEVQKLQCSSWSKTTMETKEPVIAGTWWALACQCSSKCTPVWSTSHGPVSAAGVRPAIFLWAACKQFAQNNKQWLVLWHAVQFLLFAVWEQWNVTFLFVDSSDTFANNFVSGSLFHCWWNHQCAAHFIVSTDLNCFNTTMFALAHMVQFCCKTVDCQSDCIVKQCEKLFFDERFSWCDCMLNCVATVFHMWISPFLWARPSSLLRRWRISFQFWLPKRQEDQRAN